MYARAAVYDGVDMGVHEVVRGWAVNEGMAAVRVLPGYLGGVVLFDAGAQRAVGIGLYADRATARRADELMRSAPPSAADPSVVEALGRTTRSMAGVFEVVQIDGVRAGREEASR